MRPRFLPSLAVSIVVSGLTAATPSAADQHPPNGTTWTAEQRAEVLARTLEIRLDPDLSALSLVEREALDHLVRAGQLLHQIYLESRHEEGRTAREQIRNWRPTGDDPTAGEELGDLFRTFNGPIATTLENRRVPFVAVGPERPGKNVYPESLATETLEQVLDTYPETAERVLGPRTVVRATSAQQLAADRKQLTQHPTIATLHPGLEGELEGLASAVAGGQEVPVVYAIPYSLAYIQWIEPAYAELRAASYLLRNEDPDLAAYLANRARDLLSDDYESGDASWITGSFGNLNAQLGSYETYDDQLRGVKTFFSTSLLVRDVERSQELSQAIGGLQAIEDALPYQHHKTVRSDIPVGIYHVIVDFGQARGTNTASILPNDPNHARKYGRTILLRHNIMTHPEIFAEGSARFTAAVVPEQAADLTLDGNFERTLWHEVGHYLGVAKTQAGKPVGDALGPYSDLLEEMKSDLVSLFTAPRLAAQGYHDEAALRSVYASGVLRTLPSVKPRSTQPYQTMQLMQMNWFLNRGLLTFEEDGRLRIDYDRFPSVVEELLREVMALQYAGDVKAAGEFVARWTTWNPDEHEVLAQRLRDAQRYRYRRVRYAILGE